jgi:arylsulfatase A-like enzyme
VENHVPRFRYVCLVNFCFLVSLGCSLSNVAQAAKPNILLVLFDDLGWGQPGCYNADSKLNTPRLDQLASEGLRFTDAHSAAAVCTPTRYGLLTGRYPWRLGQYGVLTTFSPPIIKADQLTLPALLKQQGYTTACIGKWHLGMQWQQLSKQGDTLPLGAQHTRGPNSVGFDYFYGFTHARNIEAIIEQDRVVEHVEPVANQPRMIQKAVEWIAQRRRDEPFFLYFPMCPPHTPIVPAADLVGKSGGVDLVGKDKKYPDWLWQGDAMLGQLLQALQEHGHDENTLVIVTSDNGAEHRAYAPLRESKRSIYEGGHRVPCVVRWPGKVKPNSECAMPICLNDFFATCAEIVEAPLPPEAAGDSVSILPCLLGKPLPERPPLVQQSASGSLAIREGNWKLIFHVDGRRELFELDRDLSEKQNVLAAHGDVAQRLQNALETIIARGRTTPGAQLTNEKAPKLAPVVR